MRTYPVYSSDKKHHRLHRDSNRRLNSVLYISAIVWKRWDPSAPAFLARHEKNEGKRGARRILQRHLVDVIYRTMLAINRPGPIESHNGSEPLDIRASTACYASSGQGTDLSRWSAEDIEAVTYALNTRTRKTLHWQTPGQVLDQGLIATAP